VASLGALDTDGSALGASLSLGASLRALDTVGGRVCALADDSCSTVENQESGGELHCKWLANNDLVDMISLTTMRDLTIDVAPPQPNSKRQLSVSMTFTPFNLPIPGVRGRHDLSPYYIAITRRKFFGRYDLPPFYIASNRRKQSL
jgi:hypothetical protein